LPNRAFRLDGSFHSGEAYLTASPRVFFRLYNSGAEPNIAVWAYELLFYRLTSASISILLLNSLLRSTIMPHFSCTIDEPIPDIETFEERLRETKVALGSSGGQGDEGYNLDLALDAIEEAKFLNIKVENKVKAKAQKAPRVFF
jgi:hypothetical protein